jgi:hypothetical protein
MPILEYLLICQKMGVRGYKNTHRVEDNGEREAINSKI